MCGVWVCVCVKEREREKKLNFLKVTLISTFIYSRRGSIITSTQLAFSFNQAVPSVEEISKTLLTAVGTGDVNPLNIIPQSISVNGSGKLYYSEDLESSIPVIYL